MKPAEKERFARPANRDEYNNLLKDPGFVAGVLLHIYSFQLADETANQIGKVHKRFGGFEPSEVRILSGISEFFLSRGFLTEKHINFVRKPLKKYADQVIGYNILLKPTTNKQRPIPKPRKKAQKLFKKVILLENEKLIITFPYDPKSVGEVKSLSGRRWNPDGKFWDASLTLENVETLKDYGFELSKEIQDWLSRTTTDCVLDISDKLDSRLYNFQKEGIEYISRKQGRALIADEMGLGKTAQALGWLSVSQELPALIVVPASLKINWRREIAIWCPELRVEILSGKTPHDKIPGLTDVVIINYDILTANWNSLKKLPKENEIVSLQVQFLDKATDKLKTIVIRGRLDNEGDWLDPVGILIPSNFKILKWKSHNTWENYLKELHFKTLIIDESHYCKDRKSARTEAVQELAKSIKNMIALTGTPITNRPAEFFTILNLLRPEIWSSFWKYAQKYCAPVRNPYGWDFTGSSNTLELHEEVSKYVMIRRKKSEVLKDLPAKVRTVIPIEGASTNYFKAEKEMIEWYKKKKKEIWETVEDKTEKAEKIGNLLGAKEMVKIEKLKQIAVRDKLDSCLQWIKDFLESGEKLVIFAIHKETINSLMKEFGSIAVKVDGSVTGPNRDLAVQLFQNEDRIRLFIGNIKAAGVGLTLTAASNTCFLELGWTPGDHDQAEDRVHRIGQEADSVNAWYLLAAGTIEEKIAELIEKKRKVLAAVLDGEDVQDESIFDQLISSL